MLTASPVDTSATVDAGTSDPISLRAYARHRGVSAEAVSRAVKTDRLKASVVRIDGVPKIADVALADQEWSANTDLSKAPTYVKERAAKKAPAASAPPLPSPPPPGDVGAEAGGAPVLHGGMSLTDATVAEKYWSAKRKELDYQRERGELVAAKDIAAMLASTFTLCRTKLLAIPSKAKTALPALTPADIGTIDKLIREALEDLAQTPIAVLETEGTAAA